MSGGFPSFDEFYRATNRGCEPFPWQSRLAAQVATAGWPEAIGVPTGLGKTACLDIALWDLARQAERPSSERSAPTRIWYVVNRRLLVDTAYCRGQDLARWLADPDDFRRAWPEAGEADVDCLREVAAALRKLAALGVAGGPLQVTRLRGGAELGSRPPDPSQPALVFATVPMFASRWLFRGYGTSAAMRPVDAALAGLDSLVLLDEAHLARPLLWLTATAAECDLGDPSLLLPRERARPRFVSLTATGERQGPRFDLDEDDRRHPIVSERLRAAKPVELVEAKKGNLDRELPRRALALLKARPLSSCVVFCNTARRARAVFNEIERSSDAETRTLLLTGRIREREASTLRKELLDPGTGAPAGGPAERTRGLIVVATQTLEVGADLDFDYLVTECAGVRALTQRFGRLNRLGRRPHAEAVIVHPADAENDPTYGEEPSRVWKRLRAARTGALNLSPEAISSALGEPEDEPPRAGELLPIHLWEYAKTSSPPPGEAPPEVFFMGFDEEMARVSVCWRAHLPRDGVRLFPGVREDEAVEIPIGELRETLKALGIDEIRRLGPDRGGLETVKARRLRPGDQETVKACRLRPGDQVVLPVNYGLYDLHGWNPEARSVVLDAAALSRRILWLEEAGVLSFIDLEAPADDVRVVRDLLRSFNTGDRDAEPDPEHDAEVTEDLLQCLQALPPHPWLGVEDWHDFLDALAPKVERPVDDAPFLKARARPHPPRTAEVRVEAFEELSFDASSAGLHDHLGIVGETARRIAAALGLPAHIVETLRLAGRLHDVGKADRRFQRWLNPDHAATEPLAKSGRPRSAWEADRRSSGWPRGGRHELLSGRLVETWLGQTPAGGWDPDLLFHLVMSHHGGGRPLVSVVADPVPGKLEFEVEGSIVIAHGDLSIPDFDQPGRFRRLCERYGYWGLGLLEAIVRQADHAASSVTGVA